MIRCRRLKKLHVGLEMKFPRRARACRRSSSFIRVKTCCCPALSHEMRMRPSRSSGGASNRYRSSRIVDPHHQVQHRMVQSAARIVRPRADSDIAEQPLVLCSLVAGIRVHPANRAKQNPRRIRRSARKGEILYRDPLRLRSPAVIPDRAHDVRTRLRRNRPVPASPGSHNPDRPSRNRRCTPARRNRRCR